MYEEIDSQRGSETLEISEDKDSWYLQEQFHTNEMQVSEVYQRVDAYMGWSESKSWLSKVWNSKGN